MKRGSQFSLSPVHSGNATEIKKIPEDHCLKLYCNNSLCDCHLTESDT